MIDTAGQKILKSLGGKTREIKRTNFTNFVLKYFSRNLKILLYKNRKYFHKIPSS